MTQDIPSVRSHARSMLLHGATGGEASAETWAGALDRVSTGLRDCLTPIVGREGFQALLSRSLALAKRESAWLDTIQLDGQGALVGLSDAIFGQGAAEVEAGCASLVAHLLELLSGFIGEGLTRRLLGDLWPEAPAERTDRGTEDLEG